MKQHNLISRFLLGLAALGVGSALLGCGSDTSSSAEEPPLTTKASYVKRATTICTEGKEHALFELGKYIKQQEDSGKTEAEIYEDGIQAAYLPQVQDQLDELRALGVQKGYEKQTAAFLAETQKAIDAANEDPPKDSTQFYGIFHRAGTFATVVGVDVCAYG